MNWKEVLQKYGVWIAAGALVLYLVLKNKGAISRPVIPGAQGGADFAAQTERLRQSGAFDLERLKLENALEAQRLKFANDRFNLEQQALARNRALDIANRGQTTGLIGQLLKNLESILKGGGSSSRAGSTGGGEGRSLPSTPNTFPGRPQLPPSYPIPQPNIPDLFNPPFTPEYPQITDYPLSVTDWGEAPQFSSAGMDVDTGASFYDQWAGGDFNYGYGYDSGDIYSANPELNYGDYAGDIGLEDFTYGYGAGESVEYGGYPDYGGGEYGFGGDE